MKLRNILEVNAFLDTVNDCAGNVYLVSIYGDRFNLKSKLSTYIAVSELLQDKGEDLELFCDNKLDESKFFQFFRTYPKVLRRYE